MAVNDHMIMWNTDSYSVAYSSDDGVTWAEITTALGALGFGNPSAVVSDGTVWVMLFAYGAISVSADGATWSNQTDTASTPLYQGATTAYYSYGRDALYIPARLTPTIGTVYRHRWLVCGGYSDTADATSVRNRRPALGMTTQQTGDIPLTGARAWRSLDLPTSLKYKNCELMSMAFDPYNFRIWFVALRYDTNNLMLWYADQLETSGGGTALTLNDATSTLPLNLRTGGHMLSSERAEYSNSYRIVRLVYDWTALAIRLVIGEPGSYAGGELDSYMMVCGAAYNSNSWVEVARHTDSDLVPANGAWVAGPPTNPGSKYSCVDVGGTYVRSGIFTRYISRANSGFYAYDVQSCLHRSNAGTFIFAGSDGASGDTRVSLSAPGVNSDAISWSGTGLPTATALYYPAITQAPSVAASLATGVTMPMPAVTTWTGNPPTFYGLLHVDTIPLGTMTWAGLAPTVVRCSRAADSVALTEIQDISLLTALASLADVVAASSTITMVATYMLQSTPVFSTTTSTQLTATQTVADALHLIERVLLSWPLTLSDSLALTSLTTGEIEALLRSIASFSSTNAANITAKSTLADVIAHLEELELGWPMTLSDSLAATDATLDLCTLVSTLVDALSLTEGVTTRLTAINLLADIVTHSCLTNGRLTVGLTLTDTSGFAADMVPSANMSELMTDTAAMTAAVEQYATAVATILDALVAIDAATVTGRVAMVLSDTVNNVDTLARALRAVSTLTDEISLYVTFRIGDELYRGYVLNPANKAASEYTNFNFNSLAEVSHTTYLASLDGLYSLTGGDDDGTIIESAIRTGLLSIAGGKMAQVVSAYIGYASDSTVVIKAIVTGFTGEKVEHWYQLTPQDAGVMREGRIQLGKGLKSVYWAFELCNVAGGTLDIDNIQLHRINLDRRI